MHGSWLYFKSVVRVLALCVVHDHFDTHSGWKLDKTEFVRGVWNENYWYKSVEIRWTRRR